MVAHAFNPRTWRQRRQISNFEACLVYRVSSRTAIKLSIESSTGEIEKGPKELKAFAGPQEGQQ